MNEKKYDIRMVALDLDGTVLNRKGQVTPRTAEAIAKAVAKGVVVLPATGRPLSGVPFAIANTPGIRYAVTTNGAAVWDMGPDPAASILSRYSEPNGPTAEPTLILGSPLPTETALAAWELLRQFDGDLHIFSDGRTLNYPPDPLWYRSHTKALRSSELRQKMKGRIFPIDDPAVWLKEHPNSAEKLCMFFATPERAKEVLAAVSVLPNVEIVQGAPDNVEITAQNVDKGEALLALGARLGIRREQILAVGDSDNDRAMLEKAGVAAVMANGMPHIKALADIVTENDCDHDGVAELLEMLIL